MKKFCAVKKDKSLETERLRAFLPTIDFLDDYVAMLDNKDFVACYGVHYDHQKAKERLLDDILHWEKYGFGVWMWRDKASGAYVGRGGLKNFALKAKDEIELSYAIKKELWGNGLALEIAQASIDFAKENLHVRDLICFTLPTNTRSLRVMEKIGFKYEGDFVHSNRPHKLQRILLKNL